MQPANWYPDPAAPGQQRWWNGEAWTEQVRPADLEGASAAVPAETQVMQPVVYAPEQTQVIAPVAQAPAPPPTVHASTPYHLTPPEPKPVSTGLIIGLMAALIVVIAVVVGIFLLRSGGEDPYVPIVVQPTPEPEPTPEPTPEPEPEPCEWDDAITADDPDCIEPEPDLALEEAIVGTWDFHGTPWWVFNADNTFESFGLDTLGGGLRWRIEGDTIITYMTIVPDLSLFEFTEVVVDGDVMTLTFAGMRNTYTRGQATTVPAPEPTNQAGSGTSGERFPDAMREDFIQECAEDESLNEAMCGCVLEQLEERMTREEFTQFIVALLDGDDGAMIIMVEVTLACMQYLD